MKILADENLDACIVEFLRNEGHEVLWITEDNRGHTDPDILQLALENSQLVITNDLDFGELVFRQGLPTAGIVLLRLRSSCASELLTLFQLHWKIIESKCCGHFIVATNRTLRIRPL